MSALAFDFGPADGVSAAPMPRRRLYAVRGSVDAPPARAITLDSVLDGAWSALATGASATCPVCSSALRPRRSAGSAFAGGRCEGCGSSLQ